jgi:hypothetical protein
MLAVLEETVAYVLELCRETEGSNQNGAARITVTVQ